MSSTVEEIDGNCNITTEFEEKDGETIATEASVAQHLNGNGCMESLNGDEFEEDEDKILVERTQKLCFLNGVKRDKEQELKYILSEYEHTKSELLKLQTDYRLSVEREKNLCEKIKTFQYGQDASSQELRDKNENLQHELNIALGDVKELTDELKRVKETNRDLEKESDSLTVELSTLQSTGNEENATLKENVEQLESKLQESSQELEASKEKLQAHDQAAKRAIAALQKEMALRVDQVTKMYDDVLKEKENVVIKLAQAEEEKKRMAREHDLLGRKLSENAKEIEKFRQKLKTVHSDYSKLQTAYEEKGKEVITANKEAERLFEEVSSQAVKVKWAQNKLKTELEAHKESKNKLVQVTHKLKQVKEEADQVRADCQAMIKQYQESEEMRSNSLDSKLKAKEVELRRHEQEIADQDEVHKMKVQELVALKEQGQKDRGEVKSLKAKVIALEEKITEYALKVAEHEKNAMTYKKEQQTLLKRLEESQAYQQEYESEVKKVKQLLLVEGEQKSHIGDLEADIIACHSKEAELLSFSEKMTAKSAQLQSEITGIQAKLDAILLEKSKVEEHYGQTMDAKRKLEEELAQRTSFLENEIESLKSRLEEKTKAMTQLTVSLEDTQDELQVLKRKNTAVIKDLTRQLQQSRKQVEKLEATNSGSKESLSEDSKSSSTNSLDKIGSACTTPTSLSSPSSAMSATDGGWVVVSNPKSANDQAYFEPSRAESVQIVPQRQKENRVSSELEPDKAVLVERICRLQKIHAKKNEKLEFLEGHINALVDEIHKKNKIIHYYVLREQAGTLAPPKSDLHKAQVARHGGIMASVYSSKAVDPDMTLDLSLEINRKLQAVLEDTILKNITLKENLDTLGDEITRLNEEIQSLRRSRRS